MAEPSGWGDTGQRQAGLPPTPTPPHQWEGKVFASLGVFPDDPSGSAGGGVWLYAKVLPIIPSCPNLPALVDAGFGRPPVRNEPPGLAQARPCDDALRGTGVIPTSW